MKRLFFIIFLLLPVLLLAQEDLPTLLRQMGSAGPKQTVGQTRPGAGGMASGFDLGEGTEATLRLVLNGVWDKYRGSIQKRAGITWDGDSSASEVVSAIGFFNSLTNDKFVIGVLRIDTLQVTGYKTAADAAIDSLITLDSGTVGGFYYSDKFKTTPGNPILNWPIGFGTDLDSGTDVIYSPVENVIFATDGDGPLTILRSEQMFWSGYRRGDSISFKPQAYSLDPPGVPRAYAFDNQTNGKLDGLYQYRLSFLSAEEGFGDDSCSYPGLPTPVISVDSGFVMLTAFPLYLDWPIADVDSTDAGDSNFVLIERRNVGENLNWFLLDSLRFNNGDTVWFLDNAGDTLSAVLDTGRVDSSINVPGEPGILNDDSTGWDGAGWLYRSSDNGVTIIHRAAFVGSTYTIAYSWYDKLTGFESAVGPSVPVTITTDTSFTEAVNDTIFTIDWLPKMYLPWANWQQHTKHIRIYTSLTESTISGAGDSSVLYSYLEVDLDTLNTWTLPQANGYDSVTYGATPDSFVTSARIVVLGMFSDTSVANGISLQSTYLGYPGPVYFRYPSAKWQLYSDEDGAIVRPPYIGQLFSTFSDIAFSDGRMYGSGDKEFPSRLYYSGIDAPYDWPINNYLSIDEDDGDEIVGIERLPTWVSNQLDIGGKDIIAVFKHRKVFVVSETSTDGTFDVFPMSSVVGAISNKGIVTHDDGVYFVDNTLKIYRLGAKELKEISTPIWDEAVFTLTNSGAYKASAWFLGSKAFAFNARAMRFNDFALWVNQTSGYAIGWNTVLNTWSKFKLSDPPSAGTPAWTSVPMGSFNYDTSSAIGVISTRQDLLYTKGDSTKFYRDTDTANHDADTLSFVFEMQTPFYGGGEFITMQQVMFSITGTTGATCSLFVRNEDSDTLATAAFTVDTTFGTAHKIGLPDHSAKWLSLTLKEGPSKNQLIIHDFKIQLISAGKTDLK